VSSLVPFVFSKTDCSLASRFHSDSEVVRVSLEAIGRRSLTLPASDFWVDAAIDGFDNHDTWDDIWTRYAATFVHTDLILDSQYQENPDSRVGAFVTSVMSACADLSPKPKWISVPQLPYVDGSLRNKINRLLAKAAGDWKRDTKFRGKLILPIVITHQDHVNLKTARTPKVTLAKQCFLRSGADGYWVAEASLGDQAGAGTYDKVRFPAVIEFHRELREALGHTAMSIAGPYWGLNLVLWARGLVDYPAIGLGVGYQYRLPGGLIKGGKTRIALGALRRCAVANPELEEWLRGLPRHDSALRQTRDLASNFARFTIENKAREQVCGVYKAWFDLIDAVQPAGRALALYQDLSAAYVLGKGLPSLPDSEGTARRPERVAQQLMLQCL
jgi:hypothetical protein